MTKKRMSAKERRKRRQLITTLSLLCVVLLIFGGILLISEASHRKEAAASVFTAETEAQEPSEVPEEISAKEPAPEVSQEAEVSEEPETPEESPADQEPEASQEESPEPEVLVEEEASEAPEEEDESWKLILVNRDHPLPEDYTIPEFTELRGGNRVDSRIYPELQAMFDDMRAAGYIPKITESYRTHEDQVAMMEYYVQIYLDQGYGEEEARDLADNIVAEPGTSEHELGLAVDISSENAEVQAPADIWAWLKEHCQEYGFILRYPEDKTEITGIDFEPWHFRYVGREDAEKIMEQGVCLEEYLGVVRITQESQEEQSDEDH